MAQNVFTKVLPVLCLTVLAACSAQDEPPAQPAATAGPAAAPPRQETAIVNVCGQAVQYDRIPQRAVTHDINITEMFLYLGLADRLVGYSGIRLNKTLPAHYEAMLAHAKNLSSQGMNIETIVGAEADFVFGGWSYGFREGQVTPQALGKLGIASYVLTESCVRKVPRQQVSVEDTFTDMLNLGRIFGIEAHAQALVDAQRAELQAIATALQGTTQRPRVFVYDSGTDVPQTSGRFGMPSAMIEAAGGSNIFDDVPNSWIRGNWEDVVERNPEWIIVVDYDQPDPQGKIDFLLGKPELAKLSAIRNQNFIVLEYAEATPGPRNVARVRTLAQAFHPDRISMAAQP